MPTGGVFHKVLESIKTAFFAAGAVFLTCFAAWAAGISVPENSQFNVNSGQLRVELDLPGTITNSGTIKTTTGSIYLNGDWTIYGSGHYDPGAGNVFFTASSGTQLITPGNVNVDAFYHLTHASTGLLKLSGNAINIQGDFNNLAGVFNASGLTMNVRGDWHNSSTQSPSFIPEGGRVNLVGTDQEITGETSFYDLAKHLTTANAHTLTLPAGKAQTISHFLILRGYDADNLLFLRSSEDGVRSALQLSMAGGQDIRLVDVKDNDASAGVLLIGRGASHNSGNNDNWAFGMVTVKWDGSEDNDWNNAFNWNLGIVPEDGDTAIIRSVDEDNDNAVIVNQPVLNEDLSLASLQVRSGASLTLDQHDLAVDGDMVIAGTLVLNGTESVSAATLVDTGTFKYIGVPNAAVNININNNFIIGGNPVTTFHGLVIDEQYLSEADTFTTLSDLNISTNADFTTGNFLVGVDKLLKVDGTLRVNGGTLSAPSSRLDVHSFIMTNGTFSAPQSGYSFTVEGDFTHSGGVFIPNNGVVRFDGTGVDSNQTIRGDTGFYGLAKEIPAGSAESHTLTFWAGDIFMVRDRLTLKGLATGNLLKIVSSTVNTAASLRLMTGAVQEIQDVSVRDNDASSGLLLIGRGSSATLGNNSNWSFGAVTLRWDGSSSRAWEVSSNWDLGTVPIAEDIVLLRSVDQDNGATIVNQPLLSADISVGSMILNDASASLTLNGYGLQVRSALTPPGSFSNNGTIYLNGGEVVDIAGPDIDSGTFVYRGDGAGTEFVMTEPSVFYNLQIAPPLSGTSSTFIDNIDLMIYGSLGISGSALDASGASVMDVNRNVILSGGSFVAPGVGNKDLMVGGNFIHTDGMFDHNDGTVILDGTSSITLNEQLLSGDTTFYNLEKIVPAGAVQVHRLRMSNTATQRVINNLTLRGIAGNDLQLRSVSADPDGVLRDANILLQPGALQDIAYVNVYDSDASGGIALVARDSDDHSADQYNNTNWIFSIPTVTWTGSVSTDWSDPRNWDLGLVPAHGDDVVIEPGVNQPQLTALSGGIALRNLVLRTGTSLTTNGFGLSVAGSLSNDGNIILQGNEPVLIADVDIDSGTFTYTGTVPATVMALDLFDASDTSLMYYNLVIAAGAEDVFRPAADLVVNGGLTMNGGMLDVSAGHRALTIVGDMAMLAGSLEAQAGSITAQGAVILNGGELSAPGAAYAFMVQGDWRNTNGDFIPHDGRVILNGTLSSTVSGDTTFHDLTVTGSSAGKTVYFANGSVQTIEGELNLFGDKTNDLVLRSTTDSAPGAPASWTLRVLSGTPQAMNVDVRDSVALFPDPPNATTRPYVFALNSIDRQIDGVSTNTGWVFAMLDIVAPADDRSVESVPTIIGHGVVGEVVTLKDGTGAVIATTRADMNGNFRVILGQDDAAQGTVTKSALDLSSSDNDREIIPSYSGYTGNSSLITVVANADASQVPVISSPVTGERLESDIPTLVGRGKPGETVKVVSKDLSGTMILSLPPEAYMGQGVVDANGDFSVTLTRALPRGLNHVCVIVNGVASEISTYIINDLHGIVFDAVSDRPLNNAHVYLLRMDGTVAVPGVDLGSTDVNPVITGPDGLYAFLTALGSFRTRIETGGYVYPTALADSDLPAGHTIVAGSRGESFVTTTGQVRRVDQPMDPSPYLLKIEKKANKSEAKIGEVITYTVTIENLLQSNSVVGASLVDIIPPGFKFISGRAQLDGVPIPDPAGNRPLWFATGDFAPQQKKTLRYQLVIGSGVAPGAYENVAHMKYANGFTVSNRANEAVQVILDPLFDAGTVFGKVFYDLNENGRQDDPDYIYEDRESIIEGPVPHVRLVMEDGAVVTADANGQFHVPALLPGRHLLRLDERSLPPGAYLTTDKVQVIDVTAGSILKVNFGVNIDNVQVTGDDAQFFQKRFMVDQSTSLPKPRLNVDLFNEDILLHNDMVIEQIEWRMFSNYAPFFVSWQLDVIDADTKKLVKTFTGARGNINDPVLWDGRDASGKYIQSTRHYAYLLKVKDDKGRWDETREKALPLKVLTDAEMTERQRQRSDQEKADEASGRAKSYRSFLAALSSEDALKVQNIWVKGDTIILKASAADVRRIRVLKNGELYVEVPVLERHALSARDLVEGQAEERSIPMEVILPDGDYEIEVADAAGSGMGGALAGVGQAPAATGGRTSASSATAPLVTNTRYKRPLKVGEDYLMFVAMGDGKAGFNMNKGNIEPVQNKDTYRQGFYAEGKLAYYLKGKIKGKYIVTSSFDTERLQKSALRAFKDEEYYPVYGDSSTINYDATDTEGPLYLSVEWDKSRAIWGNYAVAFNDTEFANYTRSLYGGKLDYKTVASTDHGEAKTQVAVFHAEVRQRSAHNEFAGTGGSLYYFKHQDIVPATEKMKIEVRDQVTGLVKSTVEVKEGVDYEMDHAHGRAIFWRPISMSVGSDKLVSNGLLNGDPVYLVADYEYFVQDQLSESTRGARVAQVIGKDVVLGATYVSETQAARNYELQGQDVTVHLGKDATIKAEYAETSSDAQNNYISTDGGITFSELASADNSNGKAYGIRQDARLFDRVGLKSYYKWIGDGFSTGATTSQQGKELKGLALTFDITPVTRLTASQDIQRLIDRGNLQTSMQVGGKETTTTLVQLVHEARRLRLSYALQNVQVKTGEQSTRTTQETGAGAFQAEYALNPKTDLLLKHQATLIGTGGQATTLGFRRQLTDRLSTTIEETFGTDGSATKAGFSANVTPQLALNTDYTLARTRTGDMQRTVALGGRGQINDMTSLEATTSVTESNTGMQETTTALAAGTKVDDADLKLGVERAQSADPAKGHQALVLQSARTGKEGRQTTSGVKLQESAGGDKATVITAGEKGRMPGGSEIGTERSFSFGAAGQESADTYTLSGTNRDGRTVQTSYARKLADKPLERSDSNIFALSGDVNDRVALQGSLERGKAMNVDGSIYDRTVIAAGLGYVEKDPETGSTRLQSSTKLEARFDSGESDRQQYVFYQSAEGRLNEQTTVRGKFNYSLTKNMDTGKAEAHYKEIMLGGAYRPIASDRINLFGEYTYKENQAPTGQSTTTDVEQTKMHVLALGAAYELDDKWELIEKLAVRVMEEKVTGFEFAKTHTWLLVNRANYRLSQDWKIGAEYRILTVKEAKDQKKGMLVEAVHSVSDNVELGIGYNFTNFVDDLTNLSYTVQGPYIRMTGKLYDQSPEERARAKLRWMDRRVELYAWKMVKKEVMRRDGPIVIELNQMYQMAQIANELGKYEDARQIYKDILLVTRMMYEEAALFVRQHIDFEERVYSAYVRAQELYDKKDFWQARKLWEKIVDEASKAVLE